MDEYALYEHDEPDLTGWERELFDAVSRDEPWRLVERFADLHREPGTEDERTAAKYIADRFTEYGIDHEVHEADVWIGEPESVSLAVTAPHTESFNVETDRPSIKAQSFSGSGNVSGELVKLELPEAGSVQELRGASLTELGQADRDFDGKVVLVEQPLLSRQLVMELQERGAAAYLLVHPHPDEPHFGTAMPIWGAVPTPEQTHLVPEMIIMNLARKVGDRLLDLLARNETVELEVGADVPRRWIESPLVVGRIPGEASPETDEFVLLHGHYDSYHAGVTDNATGNAGMVEVARVLNEHRDRLRRNLWIAFWPAHEGGRYGGSTWFADRFAVDLAERCVAHVNFDSPGVKDATEFEEMSVWMAEADPLCRGAIEDVAGKDPVENRPRRSGDYSFYNIGVTGLMCLSSSIPQEIREARGYHPVSGSGGNSEAWHLTTNTLDKADPDVLKRDIQVYLIILARLLADEVLPLDYRRTVDRHREHVRKLDTVAGDQFDLSPIREELTRLAERVEAFYTRIESDSIDPAVVNTAMKELQRPLVRVNFTEKGQFQQDLAVARPPYPALRPVEQLETLTGNELRFQLKELERSRNEIVHALREAQRAIDI